MFRQFKLRRYTKLNDFHIKLPQSYKFTSTRVTNYKDVESGKTKWNDVPVIYSYEIKSFLNRSLLNIILRKRVIDTCRQIFQYCLRSKGKPQQIEENEKQMYGPSLDGHVVDATRCFSLWTMDHCACHRLVLTRTYVRS